MDYIYALLLLSLWYETRPLWIKWTVQHRGPITLIYLQWNQLQHNSKTSTESIKRQQHSNLKRLNKLWLNSDDTLSSFLAKGPKETTTITQSHKMFIYLMIWMFLLSKNLSRFCSFYFGLINNCLSDVLAFIFYLMYWPLKEAIGFHSRKTLIMELNYIFNLIYSYWCAATRHQIDVPNILKLQFHTKILSPPKPSHLLEQQS